MMSDQFRRLYSPFKHRELPSRIGQWVMLNSGGPNMLVVDIVDDGLVCAWENGKKVEEALFKPVVLKFVF